MPAPRLFLTGIDKRLTGITDWNDRAVVFDGVVPLGHMVRGNSDADRREGALRQGADRTAAFETVPHLHGGLAHRRILPPFFRGVFDEPDDAPAQGVLFLARPTPDADAAGEIRRLAKGARGTAEDTRQRRPARLKLLHRQRSDF